MDLCLFEQLFSQGKLNIQGNGEGMLKVSNSLIPAQALILPTPSFKQAEFRKQNSIVELVHMLFGIMLH